MARYYLAGSIAGVLGMLAVLHVYWAAGGRWGATSAVPERDGKPLFEPSTTATLAVAAALLLGALVVLAQALDWLGESAGWVVRASCFVAAAVFVLRAIGDFRHIGLFKRIRGTRFARLDTLFYSPLCLVLGLGILVLALRWP